MSDRIRTMTNVDMRGRGTVLVCEHKDVQAPPSIGFMCDEHDFWFELTPNAQTIAQLRKMADLLEAYAKPAEVSDAA